MNRSLIIGVLVGSLLGSGGTLLWQRLITGQSPPERTHHGKGEHPEPHSWLLPPDFQSSQVFSFEGAQDIIKAPDWVTVYRASSTGMTVFGHIFSREGVRLSSDDVAILRDVITSPTTYSATSMCIFSPGVLYRITRGERHIDLLICFSCEDMGWIADEDTSRSATIGLSDIGIGSFRLLSSRAFPSDTAFQ